MRAGPSVGSEVSWGREWGCHWTSEGNEQAESRLDSQSGVNAQWDIINARIRRVPLKIILIHILKGKVVIKGPKRILRI